MGIVSNQSYGAIKLESEKKSKWVRRKNNGSKRERLIVEGQARTSSPGYPIVQSNNLLFN